MSRRGNYWDNASQESFFGHFKDEVNLKDCYGIDDVKAEVNNYMDYYNNYRYQWNLNKMTPVKYRNHLILIRIGLYLPKSKQNHMIGFRTK